MACPVLFFCCYSYTGRWTVGHRGLPVFITPPQESDIVTTAVAAAVIVPRCNTLEVDSTDPIALTEQLEGKLGLATVPLKLMR